MCQYWKKFHSIRWQEIYTHITSVNRNMTIEVRKQIERNAAMPTIFLFILEQGWWILIGFFTGYFSKIPYTIKFEIKTLNSSRRNQISFIILFERKSFNSSRRNQISAHARNDTAIRRKGVRCHHCDLKLLAHKYDTVPRSLSEAPIRSPLYREAWALQTNNDENSSLMPSVKTLFERFTKLLFH